MDDLCPIPFDMVALHTVTRKPLDQILHSASMGGGYLFPYFCHLASSLETYLSAANGICVCERVESCKSEKYKERQYSWFWPCV